jgi:rubrerythrin
VPLSSRTLGRLTRDLHQSEREEALAAKAYRSRARVAEALGDAVTAALYRHIAAEEDTHQQEYKQRREKLARK